jgi:serine/threonine protein kinase
MLIPFSEQIKGIAHGLDYLHKLDIVHGDLRSANVFVDQNGRPCIADYELVFIIDTSEFTSMKTAGSSRWTAPEIMNPDESHKIVGSSGMFTKASDIYAFAMTMIEVYCVTLIFTLSAKYTQIFTGEHPFSSKRNDSSVIFFAAAGNRPELPHYFLVKKELGTLVKCCWSQDASKRPSSTVVVQALDVRK